MHRILIIDDHPIFRHAMITILGKKFPDSETLEANSISEALTLLEQDAKFDLIMLDLNMPETCGLNGLLEIRNQHPNVPVVIISAETEKQNILQTISYGAVGFISKSSKIEEIATSIESIFEGNVWLTWTAFKAGYADSQGLHQEWRPHRQAFIPWVIGSLGGLV